MKNYEIIQSVANYIEDNLNEKLDLNTICGANGYSKYHLSRMFSFCTGFSIHEYVKRRKLTEAARMLIASDRRIIDIALEAGYANQQSFTIGFSEVYGCTPAKYRAKGNFTPIQLKFHVEPTHTIKGERIMDIRMEKERAFKLVGFTANTGMGFHVIGLCWGQLHGRKLEIKERKCEDFLIGMNDYSLSDEQMEGQPSFDYYACAEVADFDELPEGMVRRELPSSDYVVFTYKGRTEDSMEPVINYIYKEWFPQSNCVLNEAARFDFVRYGEQADADGNSTIEYWVPIE